MRIRSGAKCIPPFPEFIRVGLVDREAIVRLTSRYPPYSDYCYSSLRIWDFGDDFKVSLLDGNLVALLRDYASGQPLLSFIGAERVNRTAARLLDHAPSIGVSQQLRFVPQVSVASLDPKQCRICEDESNHDYVCSIPDLVRLQGSAFRTPRQSVNRFARRYPGVYVREMSLSNKQFRREIRCLQDRWRQQRGLTFDPESKAIERLFGLAEFFSMSCIGVYIEDWPVAYSVCEVLPSGYAIAHFAKADTTFAGASAYLFRTHAEVLQAAGCTLLNLQEDLGLASLRAAKRAFQPITYLKKYSVFPAGAQVHTGTSTESGGPHCLATGEPVGGRGR